MRIIVTGSGGFIGSHLVERLLADNHEVTAGIRCRVANLANVRNNPKLKLVACDLTWPHLDHLFNKGDVILHLAARAGTASSWNNLDEYLRCNVLATMHVLELARKLNVERLVYVSSSSVYGQQAIGPEESVLHPVSPYGCTKLAAEYLCRSYSNAYGLPIVILRPFSVYGPRQRSDMAINIFIEAMINDQPIQIHGDGTQTRGFTYVTDLVDGIVRAMSSQTAIGSTFNLGDDQEASILDVIGILSKILGKEVHIVHGAVRLGDQTRTVADIEAARLSFGYKPLVPLNLGLRTQVEYQRGNRCT